jgi:hypothetical protein
VATGGTNGRVVVWDVAAGAPVAEPLRASAGDGNPALYSSAVYDVAFSRDGRWLVIALNEGRSTRLVLWRRGLNRAYESPARLPGAVLYNVPVLDVTGARS